jgi:hypothetical protein
MESDSSQLVAPRPKVLSVVVRIVGGASYLRQCLERLVPQVEGRPIEIIVPHDSTLAGIAEVQRDFPEVTFADMGQVSIAEPAESDAGAHELYDRRAAMGLRLAQGGVLAMVEDTALPDADWCGQVLDAHRRPYGIIGGAVEHNGRGALNWAVYFMDFGRYQLPLCEGPAACLTDVNVSYKRAVLEAVSDRWAECYNEATVHQALARQGVVLWMRPQIIVRQDRGPLSLSGLLRERFYWGRLFGCVRLEEAPSWQRLLYVLASPAIPFVRLARTTGMVFRGGRNRAQLLAVLPQMVVLTVAWSLGEVTGYVRGQDAPTASA